MARQSRQSRDSLKVVPFPSGGKLPKCRDKASTSVKAIYKDILDSAPPAHFRESDSPLIEALATAIHNSQVAQLNIDKYGLVHGLKPSPWTLVLEKSHKDIISLTRALRLSPYTRMTPRAKALQGPAVNDPTRPWLDSEGELDD